jgi:hypothetical protein
MMREIDNDFVREGWWDAASPIKPPCGREGIRDAHESDPGFGRFKKTGI